MWEWVILIFLHGSDLYSTQFFSCLSVLLPGRRTVSKSSVVCCLSLCATGEQEEGFVSRQKKQKQNNNNKKTPPFNHRCGLRREPYQQVHNVWVAAGSHLIFLKVENIVNRFSGWAREIKSVIYKLSQRAFFIFAGIFFRELVSIFVVVFGISVLWCVILHDLSPVWWLLTRSGNSVRTPVKKNESK